MKDSGAVQIQMVSVNVVSFYLEAYVSQRGLIRMMMSPGPLRDMMMIVKQNPSLRLCTWSVSHNDKGDVTIS